MPFIYTVFPSLASCFNGGVSVLEDIYKINPIDSKKEYIISLLSQIKDKDNKDSNNRYNGFVLSLGEYDLLDDIGNKIIKIYQKEIKKLKENLEKLKTDREEKINRIKEKSNSLCQKINDTFNKEYLIQKEKLDKEIDKYNKYLSVYKKQTLSIDENRIIDVIIKSISKIDDHVSFSRSEAKKNNVYVEGNHKCDEDVVATVCMLLYLPFTLLGLTDLSRFIANKPNEDSEQKYKN